MDRTSTKPLGEAKVKKKPDLTATRRAQQGNKRQSSIDRFISSGDTSVPSDYNLVTSTEPLREVNANEVPVPAVVRPVQPQSKRQSSIMDFIHSDNILPSCIQEPEHNGIAKSSNNPAATILAQPSGSKRKVVTAESRSQPVKRARKSANGDKPVAAAGIKPKSTSITRSRKPSSKIPVESSKGEDSDSSDDGSDALPDDGPPDSEDEEGIDLSKEPLSNLRMIINDLLKTSQEHGLQHFVNSGRQYFIRVGTLCSGTDAPLHVMKLFGMLKNDDGSPVFTTINVFGCEIEPFKQGFMMRNSKPQLLFRDARDFAADGAKKAHLISGVEADIPPVDMFIAGTSCVDFSSLNSKKTKDFAGLAEAAKEWKDLHTKRRSAKEDLTRRDLDDKSWRKAIDSMMKKTESSNTSTTTFASAMNYLKEHQPAIVIFENVESAPWDSVTEYVLPLCGYAATVEKLDTKKYYLPQTRSRKYLIAFSHKAFTVKGAQELCGLFRGMIKNLEREATSSVADFLLPINSLELHRARNEMELASQASRERDTEWAFSRSRHMAFRRDQKIPDERRYIRWKENGSSNPPAKMWKPWENRQTNRVSDLLECVYLVAVLGVGKLGHYDPTFKAQIIDCSQNVDRVNMAQPFGLTGCLTPGAIPVLTLESRPVTGSESLKLQGLPIENFSMSIETQAQLQDLAGNAMSTTVVGATILASLQSIARLAFERKGTSNEVSWLDDLFTQRDYKIEANVQNSFRNPAKILDMGRREELEELKLHDCANPISVREILAIGRQTRRRCVCYHTLAYSSMELYVCKICGASFCKSCKGNPDHQLEKSAQSFVDIGCLTYARAENELREYFPSVLPMLSGMDDASFDRLFRVLSQSSYTIFEAHVLAQAVRDGLCHSTYQLAFIEITDATRIEYTSDDTFILRVIIEADTIIWYLHLNPWSDTGEKLRSSLKATQPIARAVLGAKDSSQFPTAWEFWFPQKSEFPLGFRLENDWDLHLATIGDLQKGPQEVQPHIKALEDSHWTYHPECGFSESALWVLEGHHNKLYLFKDVDPIGPANMDEFVISSVNREMGRTPRSESRPVMLRIKSKPQIHLEIENILKIKAKAKAKAAGEEPDTKGELLNIKVQGFVDGCWKDMRPNGISITGFTEDLAKLSSNGFPTQLPADVRLLEDDESVVSHGSDTSCSCQGDQVLLRMSLPILSKVFDKSLNILKDLKTLKDLELDQQLDFAEFARLIGPCYAAVEREIDNKFGKHLLLWKDVVLSSGCRTCAPRPPELFWKKADRPQGMGSRLAGSVVAQYNEADQIRYNDQIKRRPRTFRIDHNIDASLVPHPKKQPGLQYVDIRFVAHVQGLLQQARAYLPEHPVHYQDSAITHGSFALEIKVLEDPRIQLPTIAIKPPTPVAEGDANAKQPPTFVKNKVALFPEQLSSLNWMLQRENAKFGLEFTEREVSEVYIEQLRLRVYANAKKHIVRRGRVVADNVGFGKTAVCLGLIDRQNLVDRGQFLSLRRENQHLDGMCHLHATLVIVPNQLTKQWEKEANRFLNGYRVCVLQNFKDLKRHTLDTLKECDIIICSNKVMQDSEYQAELTNLCGTNDIDITLPRVYRAWYKRVHDVLREIRGDVLQIWKAKDTARSSLVASLIERLEGIKVRTKACSGDLSFVPSPPAGWKPLLLLEYLSFARLIWDEFPYENLAVTEYVASCATTSKWMLSGTPPLTTLGEVCKVAYLFNVHIARPLAMVRGRQPPICDNPPMGPHSALEHAELYESRHSPSILKERHAAAEAFVATFMRKNTRKMDLIRAVESPVILSLSTNSLLAYMELQQELSSRTFNANSVSADSRCRLMSRVDWRGSKLGRDRSMEALMLRASASFKDVQDRCGKEELENAKSTIDVARAMYEISCQVVLDMEDRGRELLGRALFLAYRTVYITIKTHAPRGIDTQEDRQSHYFQTIEDFIESVLNVNLAAFKGLDAYKSALCMLFCDEPLRQKRGLTSGMPNDPTAEEVQEIWEELKFCDAPQAEPVAQQTPISDSRREALDKKKTWLRKFRRWLGKTPLHSRRWFYIDNVEARLSGEEMELLRLEWEGKVPWEKYYRDTHPDDPVGLVPIRDLKEPPHDHTAPSFDTALLSVADTQRRINMQTEIGRYKAEVMEEHAKPGKGRRTNTKAYWQELCLRRGLYARTTDKVEDLIKRIAADKAGLACDDDYLAPEGCSLPLEDLLQEGKMRIRGGNMEAVFDRLMHTVDKLSVLNDRLIVAHSKKNLQEVVLKVLEDRWTCDGDNHAGSNYIKCTKDLDDHHVSLLCGHVLCTLPKDAEIHKAICGTRGCTHPIKDVCIPLSKLKENHRMIAAQSFGDGALVRDPAPVLETDDHSQGPKVGAIVNLIKSMDEMDQVVVFAQSEAIMSDVYAGLRENGISHVTASELARNESEALEKFKAGLGSDVARGERRKVLVQKINSEQAAGSNLHNANHVVFVSPFISRSQLEWDMYMKQSMGRCVRYRQEKTVYIYHMLMDETIEVDTLEWRKKQEIVVEKGQAVGRFNDCTVAEFLGRFDGDQQQQVAGVQMATTESRAISLLPRDDIQHLMGDDYISLAAARASETLESEASAAKKEQSAVKTKDASDDVPMKDV